MGLLSSMSYRNGPTQRQAIYGLLACLALYIGFHQIRSTLPPSLSLLKDSFPSLLLGAAMTISLGLVPSIQFGNLRTQIFVTLGAVALAGVWFEVVVPRLADQTNVSSTGSISDFLAMLLGSSLVILYEVRFTSSTCTQSERSTRSSDPA